MSVTDDEQRRQDAGKHMALNTELVTIHCPLFETRVF
jgi:hypothetical protein